MKQYIHLFLIMAFCSGCAPMRFACARFNPFSFLTSSCDALETIKKDYLRADEFDSDTIDEAVRSLKVDYLGLDEPSDEIMAKAEIIAYNKIITTPYKDSFQIHFPKVDEHLTMPEAFPYMFVHFTPKLDEDIEGEKFHTSFQTYLVVVSRFYDKILYSGLFSLPKGDPFYRYNSIIKIIEN
jgi:hypothetical protein